MSDELKLQLHVFFKRRCLCLKSYIIKLVQIDDSEERCLGVSALLLSQKDSADNHISVSELISKPYDNVSIISS